eukprot:TRINITY_DN3358_c0_g1_i2.p1 TRINITY_DN3358_c0_g1~~TRINITY_DN3358_c0_g1_i2.p1  ORF type:complete len:253 (-),score=60.25 TRINITY_DN3358_c0_g1_i2:234-992(-)
MPSITLFKATPRWSWTMADTECDLFAAAISGSLLCFDAFAGDDSSNNLAATLRDEDGRSLLHVAAASGHAEWVRIFSSKLARAQLKPLLDASDDEGWTPLMSATSSGHCVVVEVLLSLGADPNRSNSGGRAALHYAASKGLVSAAQALIQGGADISKSDTVGCTPLHRAAGTGNVAICELLLEEGAAIDAVDAQGQTPLLFAVLSHHEQAALLLARHGADITKEDREGNTAESLSSSRDFLLSLRAAAESRK